MSEETVSNLPSADDAQSPTDNGNLQDMFSQFLKTSEENQLRHQAELSAIKAVVDRLSENSSLESISDHVETPPDRRQTNRRSSIFLVVHHLSTNLMLPQHSGYHQQLLVLHLQPVQQRLQHPFKFCRQKSYMRTS